MRFFIDNNLSIKVARALHCLVEPEHEVVHLRSKFTADTPDVEWMGGLAAEEGWIILSGDTNIRRNPHEIEAWKTAGHTMFFLKSGWMHLQGFEQAAKLFHRFPDILKLAEKAPRGGGYLVPVKGSKIDMLN